MVFDVYSIIGRSLLEKYPGFFSFGAVSKQGVPKAKVIKTNKNMQQVWKLDISPMINSSCKARKILGESRNLM